MANGDVIDHFQEFATLELTSAGINTLLTKAIPTGTNAMVTVYGYVAATKTDASTQGMWHIQGLGKVAGDVFTIDGYAGGTKLIDINSNAYQVELTDDGADNLVVYVNSNATEDVRWRCRVWIDILERTILPGS